MASIGSAGSGRQKRNVASMRSRVLREAAVTAKHEAYTAGAWGVGVSHEMIYSRERRLSSWSNATGAMPLCKALSSRRGRRAHHAQKDRVGTCEIPRLTVSRSAGGPHREGEEP